MKAIGLKTAHLTNPLGIDLQKPLLTWTCEGGVKQTAYQIRAVANGREVWNSTRIESSAMQAVYGGPAESRMRVAWTVRLWDENGIEGEETTAWFEYGLLRGSDYQAKWIDPETGDIDPKKRQPASVLRREFLLDSTENARIYATSHGIYVLWINGRRVTDNVLTPGTSEYWSRQPVQTFDVSGLLTVGKNEIRVTLGDGWWRGCNGNTGTVNVFGTDIALLLQLEVDGEVRLVSDASWQASQNGPVRFNDLQLGERVDARMEPEDWHGVKVVDHGYDALFCANTVPIKEKESFSAKLVRTPSGKTVLDFGQNMAGWVSFSLNARAGQKIKMTHGEYIGEDGEFSDQNLQTVGRPGGELHQVVEYICKEGRNEYTPTLCIFGFQVVLVETDIDIDGSEFTAHAVYSDVRQTASFTCDRELVNKLFHNAVWSQRSNFVDIPTDCPTRERSGWAGDAGLFCHIGIRLMDVYPVYDRWLGEMRADQYPDGRVAGFAPRRSTRRSFFDKLYDSSCAWGDACVIVPYTMYRLYGDRRILEDNYAFGKKWLGFCEKLAKKSRLRNIFRHGKHRKYIIDRGIHWGEWLEAAVPIEKAVPDAWLNGVPDIATAYFAQSCRMFSQIAQVLGKEADAKYYADLYIRVRDAYRWLEVRDGHIGGIRQCRFVRPLQMGLLDAEDAGRAAADLNDLVIQNGYHLNTGFLTTAHLCSVLADNGYVETAYKLLLQEGTPGWLYQVKQGATTVWESWEGNTGTEGVASLNHYSKGAVVAWLIEGICGIRVSDGKIRICPQPHPLMRHAEASFDAPCGRIESGWKYTDDGLEYSITIPANTEAVFILPDGTEKILPAGEHRFTVPCKKQEIHKFQ